MGECAREMPKYECHKKVWALRIAAIEIHEDKSATIAPADDGYDVFKSAPAWAERFKGSEEDPGYYVVYQDGFASWSPSKAFETGYTRIGSEMRAGDAQTFAQGRTGLAAQSQQDTQ